MTSAREHIEKKSGKLYGIGIGPGDPDLMTLKAVNVLNAVDHIVAPVKKEGEDSTALKIISERIDLRGKDVRELVFLMEGDRQKFEECGKDAGRRIVEMLGKGEDVAMVTLGDVSFYSTYMYLDGYVRDSGFGTEIIPGITSFSNAAALAGIPLVLGDEGLAIIPAAKMNDIGKIADIFENIVVMKAGKIVRNISETVGPCGIRPENVTVVSRAGMDGEYVGPIADREFGYFTTLIMKRQ